MWTLTDLAEGQIEALAAEGITPTPQEVLHIQQLSLDIAHPDWDAMRAEGVAVKVGGAVLRTLTIGAAYWWDAMKGDCEGDEWMVRLAFAMAHSRDRSLADATEEDVRRWYSGLTCTTGELFLAVSEVLGDRVNPRPQGEEETPGDAKALIVQEAVALFGGDPAVWEWQCAIPFVYQTIRHARQMQLAAKGAKDDGESRAYAALARYVDGIRKNRRMSNG